MSFSPTVDGPSTKPVIKPTTEKDLYAHSYRRLGIGRTGTLTGTRQRGGGPDTRPRRPERWNRDRVRR